MNGRKGEVDECVVGEHRREDPEIFNLVIVRGDDEIKAAAQEMCGLTHMLTQGKLRKHFKESGGGGKGRVFQVEIEVTKNDELAIAGDKILENGGEFFKKLSSRRSRTRSVNGEDSHWAARRGDAETESFKCRCRSIERNLCNPKRRSESKSQCYTLLGPSSIWFVCSFYGLSLSQWCLHLTLKMHLFRSVQCFCEVLRRCYIKHLNTYIHAYRHANLKLVNT